MYCRSDTAGTSSRDCTVGHKETPSSNLVLLLLSRLNSCFLRNRHSCMQQIHAHTQFNKVARDVQAVKGFACTLRGARGGMMFLFVRTRIRARLSRFGWTIILLEHSKNCRSSEGCLRVNTRVKVRFRVRGEVKHLVDD